MADKVSTLILKVDLDCYRCYKKIKKTLCQLQEKERIQSIVYDEKNNTVTVSGPFDPKRLIKKLCSKACKVIKDIQIKENKPKETKPAEEKPKEKAKEKPAEEKSKEKSAEKKPVWSAGGPGCYCNPWGYYGNYRGCTCGCAGGYGWPSYRWGPECPPVVVYGGPTCGGGYKNYKTCTFFCEEDPQSTCSIM